MNLLFTDFLIRKFISDYKNINNPQVRKQYGYLGSFVGLFSNILLFIVKLILGFMINSISLIADSFNNLSDVGSSAVALFGFKLAGKPPDKEHPFGHGRTEYISALIISLIIILVGFELLQSSFKRIVEPAEIFFNLVGVIVLVITIGVKLWMAVFNKKLGKIIQSKSLAATAVDSLSDVFATSCVVISIILSPLLSLPVDAYMGILVALAIMYSGISMARDTLNPLLGQAPEPELVQKVEELVLNFDCIEGVHDLIIHDYGPGRTMATLHAEISANLPPLISHEIIDEAERKVANELNVLLVIHMDPLNIHCEETNEIREKIKDNLFVHPSIVSFHDFRIIQDAQKSCMIFDVVVEETLSNQEILSLKDKIKDHLSSVFPDYVFVITMERQHAFLH